MTDASMQVATTNLLPTPVATEFSGTTRTSGNNANEASRTDGKTFADALKAAENTSRNDQDESMAVEKNDKSSRKEKNRSTGTRTAGSAAKRSTAGTKASAKKNIGQKQRLSLASTSARETVEDTSRPINSDETQDSHDKQLSFSEVVLQSGAVNVQQETAATARTGKNRSSADKVKASDSTRNVSVKSVQGRESASVNLSSKAGRIEVVDRRVLSEVGGKSDSDFKSRIRENTSKGRQEISTNSNSVKSFNAAVAETEIDLVPSAGKAGSVKSAAAQLADKLDGQAGSEIVRQVKVVLTKANAGEVQINLRPDNLGRVRVRIQLEDNKLTGRIFVESAAAREAFRNALDGLQTRLVESGFGSADLELTWDDSGTAFADGQQQSSKKSGDSGQSAREFENMVSTTVIDEIADGGVDLVV